MYAIVRTKGFERSFRKLRRSGLLKDAVWRDIEEVIEILASGRVLPAKCVDHALRGELKQYRECHVRNDLLLVYQIIENDLVLVLVDIGTHSYLFG